LSKPTAGLMSINQKFEEYLVTLGVGSNFNFREKLLKIPE